MPALLDELMEAAELWEAVSIRYGQMDGIQSGLIAVSAQFSLEVFAGDCVGPKFQWIPR